MPSIRPSPEQNHNQSTNLVFTSFPLPSPGSSSSPTHPCPHHGPQGHPLRPCFTLADTKRSGLPPTCWRHTAGLDEPLDEEQAHNLKGSNFADTFHAPLARGPQTFPHDPQHWLCWLPSWVFFFWQCNIAYNNNYQWPPLGCPISLLPMHLVPATANLPQLWFYSVGYDRAVQQSFSI